MSRTISLTVKDSIMNAHVAMPKGDGPFPAIILFHDAFGVNADMRMIADKFSREGFVVIVPELFHRTAPSGFEARYYQAPIVMPHVNAMRAEHTADDIQAVLKWLKTQDNVQYNKIGSVGFSMGGRLSFLANSTYGLSASVSVYGSQLHKETGKISGMRGSHLFAWGGKDEYIAATHVATVIDAMRSAGKDFVNMEFSAAKHGYFFDGHPSYDACAAKQTWAAMKEFLKCNLMS